MAIYEVECGRIIQFTAVLRIRIRIGSGSRRSKMTHKIGEKLVNLIFWIVGCSLFWSSKSWIRIRIDESVSATLVPGVPCLTKIFVCEATWLIAGKAMKRVEIFARDRVADPYRSALFWEPGSGSAVWVRVRKVKRGMRIRIGINWCGYATLVRNESCNYNLIQYRVI